MSSRRIELDELKKEDGKVVGAANGLAGEDFDTEIYQIYGLSVNPKGKNESVLIEINGDPDNFVALPPGGDKDTKSGTTTLYYDNTEIILDENSIQIKVEGKFLNIKDGVLDTDLDIKTSGKISAEKDIKSESKVIAKGNIESDANVKAQGNVNAQGDVETSKTSLNTHIHGVTHPYGSPFTTVPQ